MPQRQTFLCSKGKGNSRGLPSPPSSGPFPLPPPAAVTLNGPLPGLAAARGWGWGCRRLATCTFETKQTRPPRAHPGPEQGRLFSRCGILGSCVPQKGPERASSRGMGHPPLAPASTAVGTHKHTRGHTPTIARDRTPPPPPPGPEKETFQVVRAPPAPIAPLRRPALTFLSGFSVHAALGWVRGVLAGGGGR